MEEEVEVEGRKAGGERKGAAGEGRGGTYKSRIDLLPHDLLDLRHRVRVLDLHGDDDVLVCGRLVRRVERAGGVLSRNKTLC
jgi:hypothetical protein